MDTDDSITFADHLSIATAPGQIIAAPPTEWGIKLSPEARRTLLDAIKQAFDHGIRGELEDVLGNENLGIEIDGDWIRIEEALTEIFTPPQRWVTGLPPATDVTSRWLESYDDDRPLPPGVMTFDPPKPPAAGGMTINVTSGPDLGAMRLVEDIVASRERAARVRRTW